MVSIGVLTSSRADFGVYLPLLKAFQNDPEIHFDIIAFGAHLSNLHGYTINEIIKNGFEVKYKIPSLLADDSEEAISTSAALTSLKFSSYWVEHKNEFDIVLCLGDRYEMFSAVIAGVPFGVKFAHFYGGDYSKGVIDNVYRDSITHASIIHFTSTQKCADRINKLLHQFFSIDVIGILSLEGLENIELLTLDEFKNYWGIDLSIPSILITFHPETVFPENNLIHSKVVLSTLSVLQNKFQLIITMPNADTEGKVYRSVFEELKQKYNESVHLVENFGSRSYFTCMKHSILIMGNTSSGISEAASFNKYFINVGNRQMGREFGPNVKCAPFDKDKIIKEVFDTSKIGEYQGVNIYKKNGALELIIKRIKAHPL